MLDSYTIIDAIAEAVAGNSALSTWSSTTYGHGVTVDINYNHVELPAEANCPHFTIYPLSEDKGQNKAERVISVAAFLLVYDDTLATRSESNITEYLGTQRLYLFFQKVITAVRAVSAFRSARLDVMAEFDTTGMYPHHEAAIRFDFYEKWAMGQNPLA